MRAIAFRRCIPPSSGSIAWKGGRNAPQQRKANAGREAPESPVVPIHREQSGGSPMSSNTRLYFRPNIFRTGLVCEISSHTSRRGTCPRRSLCSESAFILTQPTFDPRVKFAPGIQPQGQRLSTGDNHPRWAATAAAWARLRVCVLSRIFRT